MLQDYVCFAETHGEHGAMTLVSTENVAFKMQVFFCIVASVIFYVHTYESFSLMIFCDHGIFCIHKCMGAFEMLQHLFLHTAWENIVHRVSMLQGSDSRFRVLGVFMSHFLPCMQRPFGHSVYRHLF